MALSSGQHFDVKQNKKPRKSRTRTRSGTTKKPPSRNWPRFVWVLRIPGTNYFHPLPIFEKFWGWIVVLFMNKTSISARNSTTVRLVNQRIFEHTFEKCRIRSHHNLQHGSGKQPRPSRSCWRCDIGNLGELCMCPQKTTPNVLIPNREGEGKI